MERSHISQKQLRNFGFLIGFGIPIIFGWVIPAFYGHLFRSWTLWVGGPSLILGIIKPQLLFYPYKLWMIIGNIMGWINSSIILGLIFLVFILPISFIMRIFGYDPLKIRKKQLQKNSFKENNKNRIIDLTRIF